MERIYREQPKNEDVRFVTIPEQMDAEYRGFEGGMGEIDNLPVDTMEGLQVSTVIPEGYYAEAAKEDAPSQDGTDEPVEGGDDVTEENVWKGGSVTLTQDIDIKQAIKIEDGIATIVELNGKTLTGGVFTESNGEFIEGNTDSYVFMVNKGGELTINGNGTIEAQEADYSMAVWANGGKVTINGGTFVNHGDGCDLIYASNGATVEIYGGEFKATENSITVPATKNKFSALNIKDKDRKTTTIRVYGGKFYGFDPSNNLSEGENTNFVAEGYQSTEITEGVWEVTAV